MYKMNINGRKYNISNDAEEFARYNSDEALWKTANAMYEVMKNTQEATAAFYNKLSQEQDLTVSELLLTDAPGMVAMSLSTGQIIISGDLLLDAADCIYERFTDDRLNNEHLCDMYSPEECRIRITQYAARFIVLHEQFHIWHRHFEWSSKYAFDQNGRLFEKNGHTTLFSEIINNDKGLEIESLNNLARAVRMQNNITDQALEMDADCSAAKALALIPGVISEISGEQDQGTFYYNEIPLIMAGIATVIYLMDKQRAGITFKTFQRFLYSSTHPIPATRLFYIESEFSATVLEFVNDDTKKGIFDKCNRIVCDDSGLYAGQYDSWSIYYLVAYTKASYEHLIILRKRFNAMYNTLYKLSGGIKLSKFSTDDLVLDINAVWFDDDGNSVRGWINPATGTTSFEI